MGEFIRAILVTVVTSAIAKGIVRRFKFDMWVAKMIPQNLAAARPVGVGWIISGIFGLIALAGWEIFHVDDRLYDLIAPPRPGFASLPLQSMTGSMNSNPVNGETSLTIGFALENGNDFVVAYNAFFECAANGKKHPTDGQMDNLSGYIQARRLVTLGCTVDDFPVGVPVAGKPTLRAALTYKVIYFGAPDGSRTRQTYKQITFESYSVFQYLDFGNHTLDPITPKIIAEIEK